MRTTEIGAWTPPIGRHAGNPPAGADDDVAADLLAQDPVRAADVVGSLRRDRRGLEPEAGLDDGSRGLVDDLVTVPGVDSSERSKRRN